jgi:hypothetical protein
MKGTVEKADKNENGFLKKGSSLTFSTDQKDLNSSVSERDYFVSVRKNEIENIEEGGGDGVVVEKGGGERGSERVSERGSVYANSQLYEDNNNNNNNNYVIVQSNNKGLGNNNNSNNSPKQNINISPKSSTNNINNKTKKYSTINDNIHYNGINNIIVNTTSSPLSRTPPTDPYHSPTNSSIKKSPKPEKIGSNNISLNINSRIIHDSYEYGETNNSDDKNTENDNNNGSNNNSNSNNNNNKQKSPYSGNSSISFSKATTV